MPLEFGWKAVEVRESFWKGDPAFRNISAQAMAAYEEDGDGSHLAPYALNGVPSKITFRSLNSDENRIISGVYVDASNNTEAWLRACILAFRIAVDFPGEQERIRTADGNWHERIVRERGVRMLAHEYTHKLIEAYPGMVEFYGQLILKASLAADSEKKASSPPSTPTPSLEAVTTSGNTVAPLNVAVA